MTEIPEHLRKRAEEAKAKAAAKAAAAAGEPAAAEPAAPAAAAPAEPAEAGAPAEPAAAGAGAGKIPAHLLERSKAAREDLSFAFGIILLYVGEVQLGFEFLPKFVLDLRDLKRRHSAASRSVRLWATSRQ